MPDPTPAIHLCMCRDCGPCGCGKGGDDHCTTCADRRLRITHLPNPNCDEPGCHALALGGVRALEGVVGMSDDDQERMKNFLLYEMWVTDKEMVEAGPVAVVILAAIAVVVVFVLVFINV